MRIVLVVQSFPKTSETFIVNKFIGLYEQGFDIHVVCSSSKSNEWSQFTKLQQHDKTLSQRIHLNLPSKSKWLAVILLPLILVYSLIFKPNITTQYFVRGWHKFGIQILRYFYLDFKFILLKPDLIHFEFGTLAIGRMHLHDLLDSKIIVSFRGYDINYVGLDTPGYYDEVWHYADGLHFLGTALWTRAQKRGCPSDNAHALITPAIDTNYFQMDSRTPIPVGGLEQRPLRILSVGRLEWKKGYEYALQAVKILIDQGVDCEYRIIGGGNHLAATAFARHQLGLDNNVVLLGVQPTPTVYEHMLWADVLMHAAVSEGFCNSVLEAQAMALPIVCSDADGLEENVVDTVTGYVVPRRNPRELADKLVILAHDPDLRLRMGLAGRERVVAHFELDQQIQAFIAFYKQIFVDDTI